MIISRTPFRISFVGGGTDLRGFYETEGGAVVSTAINKYMYIIVNKRFENSIRVSYSKTEIVDSVEQISHPIVREALKLTGIDSRIEIASMADIPAGTGLGSSSSFTVGLLSALYAYKGIEKSIEQIVKEACHIEIDILEEPIGVQDQYITGYGGFRFFQFNTDGSVHTEQVLNQNKQQIANNLMLFYTGDTRGAKSILGEQKANMKQADKFAFLKQMRDMALALRLQLNNGTSPDILGDYLHKGWLLKKKLASGISNSKIDKYYEKALKAGALGGKLLGAGGGGFLLFYCPQEKQLQVRDALSEITWKQFSFEDEGSKIINIE
ncbi:MAG: GHMP kinase [Chloroflexi bacterium]|jgi:D-glycero-alpha-D-manno-heptose-7-phosphate kinase|nr:GHMP kinase [Chloroflexota bacterium]